MQLCIEGSCYSFFVTRFGINHTIEVLTLWENNAIFTAQWVQQNKLHTKGKKELESYLLHQMLFAPIWKHVLNVAEVSRGKGIDP